MDKNSLRTRLLIEHIRSGPAGRELFFDPAIVVTSCEPLRDSLVMRPAEAPSRKPSKKQRKRDQRLEARDRLLQEIYERQPRHQKELVRDEPYCSQTMVSKLVREMQEDGLLEEDSLRVTPTKGIDLIEAIREADRAFGRAGGEAVRGRDEPE